MSVYLNSSSDYPAQNGSDDDEFEEVTDNVNNDTLPFLLPHSGTFFFSLTLAYAVFTIFGLIANSIVIFVVCRYKDMHTPTNYYFCNLALTDFLFLLLFGVPYFLNSMGVLFNSIHICRFVHLARAVSYIINTLDNVSPW